MTQALSKEQIAALRLLTGDQTASNSRELLARLAEPFAVDAVSWRIGPTSTKDPNKPVGKALAYIDSRDVQDRLDVVMGADWQDRYEAMPDGTYCCSIGIKIDGEWRWRSDGAGMIATGDAADPKTPKDADAKEMAQKGSYSDAFKRAAVKWGIGRYLYSLDGPWVPVEKRGNSFVLPDASEAQLRRWLANKLGMAQAPAPRAPVPQQEEPQTAPAREKPAPKGPSQPKQVAPKAASVSAASQAPAAGDWPRKGVIVQPAGEPTAKQLWDGLEHTDKQAGREGLSPIIARIKQAADAVAKGWNPASFPADCRPAALDAAYAEWEAWYRVMPLSDAERAKVHKAMDAYTKAAQALDAALAKRIKADAGGAEQQAQAAADAGADPESGEVQYEPVQGAA